MNVINEDALFKKKIDAYKEREKELNCLYRIEEILKATSNNLELVLQKVVEVIPTGWQYTTICEARILFDGNSYQTEGFRETEWMQHADLVVDEHVSGQVDVAYTQFIRLHQGSQFLPQEQKLLNNIADRMGSHLFHLRLKKLREAAGRHEPGAVTENHSLISYKADQHWRWRYHMAQVISEKLDMETFGVKALYIIGSTKTTEAGPASDIDLLVHFAGDDIQRKMLESWMEGWSLCLSEMNYARTGYPTEGLIDLHFITEKDIRDKSSFAVMIESAGGGASLLKVWK
ncbi:MAG: hypothetical protein JW861_09795 [Bacteroidales bacterium]|nr:hypothetical protein [Bacteroidales bacterium]